MRDFLLRRARSPALFLLLAVLLFLAAFLLASTARSADEEAAALRTQNDAAVFSGAGISRAGRCGPSERRFGAGNFRGAAGADDRRRGPENESGWARNFPPSPLAF